MPDLELLSSFDFELPEALIAKSPASPRDSSRLLVINRKSGSIEHRKFLDFPEFFGSSDLIVANNTKVLPARFLGHRLQSDGTLGGRIEFVLLEEREPLVWEGLFHASAKYLPGLSFFIETPDGQGLKGELVVGSKDMPQGTVVARFDRDPVSSGAGKLPLPHYLKRAPQAEDESSYQTVYAQNLGSAAAPTAGLHFTDSVRQKLSDRGVRWEELTLHVGLGTFRPVKSEVVTHHQMHEERFEISEHTAKAVTEAKRSHRRVCAIGTTSVRALESAWDSSEGVLKSGASRTSIFIRPGKHEFRVVDALLTNFHLPKSTLLMLVCSLAGYDLVMKAYREAVAQEYRFFSYGDAMLIL